MAGGCTLRPAGLRERVPLAPLTTLELGGPARFLLEAASLRELVAGLRWADAAGLPVALVGGGSNLVVADDGFPGLVVRLALRGVETRAQAGGALLTAAAGEPWDGVVERGVAEGLAGLECLSGIPGTAGATPVQNVGAYGQEVADTLAEVRALDRATLEEVALGPEQCGFGYRTSRFRAEPGRFAILAVTFRLRRSSRVAVRYEQLERALAGSAGAGTPGEVRQAVLALRRQKSMLLDPADPNRRSAGSFFVNPVVGPSELDEVVRRALDGGLVSRAEEMPRHPSAGGRFKLAAAWLVERSGFPRGFRRGPVGVSPAHALALVHHGGGRAADLVALAADVRAAVLDRFGVRLEPEPVFLGFPPGDPLTRSRS